MHSGGECSTEDGQRGRGSNSMEDGWRTGLGSDIHRRAGESELSSVLLVDLHRLEVQCLFH